MRRVLDVPFALVAVGYFGICAAYSTTVPMWDSRIYFDALVTAATSPFSVWSFNAAGHPTAAYFLFLSLPQYIDPGGVAPTILWNAALGVAGLYALRQILARLLPDIATSWDLCLGVALLAFQPLFLAGTVFINPDFGVLVFALAVCAALLHGRFIWAALAGVCLVFSKESGLVLYATLIASHICVFVLFSGQRWRTKWSVLWRRSYLVAPALLLALYLVTKPAPPPGTGLWNGLAARGILSMLFTVTMSRTLVAYLVGIFIISFGWLASAAIGAWVVSKLMWRPWHRRAAPDTVGASDGRRKAAAFIWLTFVLALYALTRYDFWYNIRYFLPLYGLMVALVSYSIYWILPYRPAIRRIATLIIVSLYLVSVFWTVDPVSKAIFGTFQFGRHDMLKMTTLVGRPDGYGLDQLVYNLQFTKMAQLQDVAYRSIKPTPSSTVVMHQVALWYTAGPLDAMSFRRTTKRARSFEPHYTSASDLLGGEGLPQEVYYVAFPNFDNRPQTAALATKYRRLWTRTFFDGGYSLSVGLWSLR